MTSTIWRGISETEAARSLATMTLGELLEKIEDMFLFGNIMPMWLTKPYVVAEASEENKKLIEAAFALVRLDGPTLSELLQEERNKWYSSDT